MDADRDHRVALLGFQPEAMADTPVVHADEFVTAYYLRMLAEDKPGVLADITRIFAEKDISIEAIIQKEPEEGQTRVPLILLTTRVIEKNMNDAIEEIESLEVIEGQVTRIRMEHLG